TRPGCPAPASRACRPPLAPCPCSTSIASVAASRRAAIGVVKSAAPSTRGIGSRWMPRAAAGRRFSSRSCVSPSLLRLSAMMPISWPRAASSRVRSPTCRNRPPTGARSTCRIRSLRSGTRSEPAFGDDDGVAGEDREIEIDGPFHHLLALPPIDDGAAAVGGLAEAAGGADRRPYGHPVDIGELARRLDGALDEE